MSMYKSDNATLLMTMDDMIDDDNLIESVVHIKEVSPNSIFVGTLLSSTVPLLLFQL